MSIEPSSGWYAVRSLFRGVGHEPGGRAHDYEERITLWRAASADEAFERAEAEAIEYANDVNAEYLTDFGQAYVLVDVPQDGAEIFSLIRDSDLDPDTYVGTFFTTGHERER